MATRQSDDEVEMDSMIRFAREDTAPQPGRPVPSSADVVLRPEDWVWLKRADRVRVRRWNEATSVGLVDVVAPDASIFWVFLEDGRGRIAVHEHDEVAVWLMAAPEDAEEDG